MRVCVISLVGVRDDVRLYLAGRWRLCHSKLPSSESEPCRWRRLALFRIQVKTATSPNGDNKNGDTPKRRQPWSKRRQCIRQNGYSWSKHKRIRTVRQYSGSLAHPRGMYFNRKERKEVAILACRRFCCRRSDLSPLRGFKWYGLNIADGV